MVLAGSGGALTVAMRTLPEFIRSRRSELVLHLKFRDKEFMLHASNVDDMIPIIEKLVDD